MVDEKKPKGTPVECPECLAMATKDSKGNVSCWFCGYGTTDGMSELDNDLQEQEPKEKLSHGVEYVEFDLSK
jgi:hypothetical protein